MRPRIPDGPGRECEWTGAWTGRHGGSKFGSCSTIVTKTRCSHRQQSRRFSLAGWAASLCAAAHPGAVLDEPDHLLLGVSRRLRMLPLTVGFSDDLLLSR